MNETLIKNTYGMQNELAFEMQAFSAKDELSLNDLLPVVDYLDVEEIDLGCVSNY